MRTTDKMLQDKVNDINQTLEEHGSNDRLRLYWSYGRVSVVTVVAGNEYGPVATLSPNLSNGQLMDWLCAFNHGLSWGIRMPKGETK